MKKIGFTLAELLVVSCIVGVLLWAGISTFMQYDKGIRYILSNTYYALDRALFNATTDWVPKDRYNRAIFEDSVTDKDKEGNDQKYSYDDTKGAIRLCTALTHYITPVEAGNACSPTMELADLRAEDSFFKNKKPAFTAINGVRFWITKRYPTDNSEENKGVRFYVIYADVNGERIPNSVTYARGNGRNKQTTKDPDVFAFAALAYLNGDQAPVANVIPIGIAEVEPRYLTSRIKYYDDEDNEWYSTISRPIVTSKVEAWNFYSNTDDDYSNEYTNMTNVPLAYGDYILSAIRAENSQSNIYAFLGSQNFGAYYRSHDELKKDGNGNDIAFRSATSTNGGYNCIEEDAEEEHCKVFIDKYFH